MNNLLVSQGYCVLVLEDKGLIGLLVKSRGSETNLKYNQSLKSNCGVAPTYCFASKSCKLYAS
jgi:hypothetical protein